MRILILFLLLGSWLRAALAQDAGPQSADTPPMLQQEMDMSGMDMSDTAEDWKPSTHNASGTGWQPAVTPEHMWMKSVGGWDLMAHGVIFADYNHQGGPRGEGKTESVNWLMLMEKHKLGRGHILFREMFSAESLTAPHPGFPELFQTGETYHGEPLVDHQHPHNVFSELALQYTYPVSKKLSWLFYGAAAGEPALGPVAFMHRASAAELPMAPLSHHLQDSTHTSFGVLTTGLDVYRLRIEGSLFNGREPNEHRYGIQFAALDSWSGRLSFAPTKNWTAQYSYGRLEHPEALEPGSQRRQTASVEYARPFSGGSWATSLVWGRVHKQAVDHNLNSYLLETTANFKIRNYVFSRVELVDKDELFPGKSIASQLSYWGLYLWRRARSDPKQSLAVGSGSGLDVLLQAFGLGQFLRSEPGFLPSFPKTTPGIEPHHALVGAAITKRCSRLRYNVT